MNKTVWILTSVIAVLAATTAVAQKASDWNGTWVGAWGGSAQTSVQIAHGKVVRYEYQGATVPVTSQKVSAQSVTYGVPGNYTVTIVPTSPGHATASFSSQTRGTAAADLTKQ